MANSVVFFDKNINITSLVSLNQSFFCSCGWCGVATELANSNDYSCCPKCGDYDIRMPFDFFEWEH